MTTTNDPARKQVRIDRNFASRVDWNLLRLFVEIVQAGGIGAAARRLNRQQPSVSAALKRLEEHIGTQLLRRTAAGVEATTAGRALLLICEDMFESARIVNMRGLARHLYDDPDPGGGVSNDEGRSARDSA